MNGLNVASLRVYHLVLSIPFDVAGPLFVGGVRSACSILCETGISTSAQNPVVYQMPDKTLSPEEIALVDTVSAVIAALSLCGSTFIIVCFVRLKELRTFPFSLVAILSATDVCNIVFDLMSPPAKVRGGSD